MSHGATEWTVLVGHKWQDIVALPCRRCAEAKVNAYPVVLLTTVKYDIWPILTVTQEPCVSEQHIKFTLSCPNCEQSGTAEYIFSPDIHKRDHPDILPMAVVLRQWNSSQWCVNASSYYFSVEGITAKLSAQPPDATTERKNWCSILRESLKLPLDKNVGAHGVTNVDPEQMDIAIDLATLLRHVHILHSDPEVSGAVRAGAAAIFSARCKKYVVPESSVYTDDDQGMYYVTLPLVRVDEDNSVSLTVSCKAEHLQAAAMRYVKAAKGLDKSMRSALKAMKKNYGLGD